MRTSLTTASLLAAAVVTIFAGPARASCGADRIDTSECDGGTVRVGTTAATGLHIFETDRSLVTVADLASLGPSGNGHVVGYRVTDTCVEVALDSTGCHTRECQTADGAPGVYVHLLFNLNGYVADTDPGWRPVQPTPCQPLSAATVDLPDLDAAIARAFEGDIPIPATTLGVSPPGGATLTGLPTLFRADPPPGATTDGKTVAWTFPFRALGGSIPVTVTGTPSFTWQFGDGTTLTTLAPGTLFTGQDPRSNPAAYPVQHTYKTTGPVTVTETTTWAFTYVTPAGTRRTVPGTVVRTSTSQLTVSGVRARLVDHG